MIILSHLGLGDHLLTQGIVRHFAETRDHIVLPCYAHNLPTLSHLYGESMRIHLHPVTPYQASELAGSTAAQERLSTGGILALGHYGKGFRADLFDKSFYAQAELPFSLRYERFLLPKHHGSISFDPGYALIHADASRGLHVHPSFLPKDLTIHLLEASESLFDWTHAITHAAELHFISSSPLILADSLDLPPAQRRYVHAYAREGALPHLRHNWTILTASPAPVHIAP